MYWSRSDKNGIITALTKGGEKGRAKRNERA
jgi:hypothetical protein